MTNLPKPTIIQISQWEKEYYSMRMPNISKEDYIKQRTKEWYRTQWYLKNNK